MFKAPSAGIGLALLLLTCGRSASANDPLEAQVSAGAVVRRPYAPFPLRVTVNSQSAGVLAGRLEFAFYGGPNVNVSWRPEAVWQTETLALPPQEQSFALLAPPLAVLGDLSATLRFARDDRRISLGDHLLFVPSRVDLPLLAVFALATEDPKTYRNIVDTVRLERLSAPSSIWQLGTFPAPITAQGLPEDPLHYCAYDLVVLDMRTLAFVDGPRLQALSAWVEAGGRLAVVGQGAVPPPALSFLRRLSGNPSLSGLTGEASASPQLFEAELGRFLRAPSLPTKDDLTSEEWRRALCFLWHVRELHTNHVAAYGTLPRHRDTPLLPPAVELVGLLMPSTLELPSPLILGLFFLGFVLCIGPLDYLLLGRWKVRRFTWVVFPLVTLAFTLAILRFAQNALGEGDRRRVSYVDIAKDGRFLRRTSFELVFAAKAQEQSIHARRALVAPIEVRQEKTAVRYEGRFPSRYVLRRQLEQWAPALHTTLELAPAGAVADFDWAGMEASWQTSLEEVWTEHDFAQRLAPHFEDLPAGTEVYLSSGESWSGTRPKWKKLALFGASRLARRGIFFRDAPRGGGSMNDLAFHDPSARGQILLSMVRSVSEDEIFVYRRLFVKERK